MLRVVLTIALFLAFACNCDLVRAQPERSQQERSLSLSDVLDIHSFGEVHPPAFSPDGNFIAFAVVSNARRTSFDAAAWKRTGVPWYGNGSDIYVLDVRSQVIQNLTKAKGNSWLPVWSPDGRSLAFLSDRETGKAELWLWDRSGDHLRKVSTINIRTNQIEWSKTGNELLITAAPQSSSVERSVPQLCDGAERSHCPRSDGSSVAVYGANLNTGAGSRSESDPWNLNEMLRDLALIHLDDGKVDYLVRGEKIARFSLSPDGRSVAYTSPNRFEKPGSQQILFDLSIAELASHQNRLLASAIRFDHDGDTFRWSPDGLWLSFQSGGPGESELNCFVIDVAQGKAREVTHFETSHLTTRRSSMAPLWSADSRTIYFLRDGVLWSASAGGNSAREIAHIPDRTIFSLVPQFESQLWVEQDGRSTVVLAHDDLEKEDGFYAIDLEGGSSKKLFEGRECHTCTNQKTPFALSRDGKQFAFIAQDAQRAEDLWIASETFRVPARVTDLNPQFERLRLGFPRLIDWMSDDGERQRGVLLLPSNYRQGDHCPLVIWIYGGVRLSDRLTQFGLGYSGPFNMQLLATRGYAVLLPDTPLPSGIHPFDLAKIVLPGVNKVIEMGVADPDRLGIMGHSFGGYSTLALISETRRFRAAIDSGGFGDLPAYYGEMDASGAAFGTGVLEDGIASMGGTPWESHDRYIENSPVFHLDRVGTPLLILHGGTDDAVAPFLADEIFVDMRRLGKQVEYARYEGEGHSPNYWRYTNQMDFCDRVIRWFDRWLKN